MASKKSETILFRNVRCNEGQKSSPAQKSTSSEFKWSMDNNSGRKQKKRKKPVIYRLSLDESSFNSEKPNDKYQVNGSGGSYDQYRALLQRICCLIEEIDAIRKNKTTGICEICKRYNSIGMCKRCEIIQNKYNIKYISDKDDIRQERYSIWIYKVKQFLYSILEKEISKQDLYYLDTKKTEQLENFLQQLKLHLNIIHLNNGNFLSFDSIQNIVESKDILENILWKLRKDKHLNSTESKSPAVPCPSTCKYFSGRYFPREKYDNSITQNVTKREITSFEPNTIEYFNNGDLNMSKLLYAKGKDVSSDSFYRNLASNINETRGYVIKPLDSQKQSEKLDINFSDEKSSSKQFKQYSSNKSKYAENKLKNIIPTNRDSLKSNIIDIKRQALIGKSKNDTNLMEGKEKIKTRPEDPKNKKEQTLIGKSENDTNLMEGKEKIKAFPEDHINKKRQTLIGKSENDTNLMKGKEKIKAIPEDPKNTTENVKRLQNVDKNKGLGVRNVKNQQLDSISRNEPIDPNAYNNLTNSKKCKSRLSALKSNKIESKKSNMLKSESLDKTGINVKKKKVTQKSTNSEDKLMLMLLKQSQKHTETKKAIPKIQEKAQIFPEIKELPVVEQHRRNSSKPIEQNTSSSESVIIEFYTYQEQPVEMIRGTNLIPIEHYEDSKTESVSPMTFKVKANFESVTQESHTPSLLDSGDTMKPKNIKELSKNGSINVFKYMLSNQEFIEKGWTMLPTSKLMRKMNIYKMLPAKPKYDWFLRNRNKYVMFYESGEKLAEVQKDGSGKWFYKNCNVALDHYISQDANCGRRYVVYSSGEKDEFGRQLPVTVLACFDYLGNGVVYDHLGNQRLKYNQTEGMVIDEKIGAPCRWKWHTLNEPPILQPVFIDTHSKLDNCFIEMLRSHKEDMLDARNMVEKRPNYDMVAIELDNFMKEKAKKMRQKFKPFCIKMKAVKINSKFSLKIMDQSNIYLIFREGPRVMKLNLGMKLFSDEIIDTDTADIMNVATPYDRYPPISQSIANIQYILEQSRKLENRRKW